MKNKIFSCVWLQPSYSINHNTLETEEFFSSKNGYSEAEIQIVNTLEIGQNLILDNQNHFITRVK